MPRLHANPPRANAIFKRNLRLDAGRKQLAAKLAKLKAGAVGEGKGGGDSGEYGISWGFDEDAVAEEEDEDDEGMEGGDDEAVRRFVSCVLMPQAFCFVCLFSLSCLTCVRVLRLSASLLAGLSASLLVSCPSLFCSSEACIMWCLNIFKFVFCIGNVGLFLPAVLCAFLYYVTRIGFDFTPMVGT